MVQQRIRFILSGGKQCGALNNHAHVNHANQDGGVDQHYLNTDPSQGKKRALGRGVYLRRNGGVQSCAGYASTLTRDVCVQYL